MDPHPLLSDDEAEQLAAAIRLRHPAKQPGETHTLASHARRTDELGRPLTTGRRDGEHIKHYSHKTKEN